MLYRKIDENGLFIEDVILEGQPMIEQEGIMKLDPRYIDVPVPSGFFHPRWDGKKWAEGLSEEEIKELTKPQPHEPTIEERLEQTEELLQTVTMAFTEYVFTQETGDDS